MIRSGLVTAQKGPRSGSSRYGGAESQDARREAEPKGVEAGIPDDVNLVPLLSSSSRG